MAYLLDTKVAIHLRDGDPVVSGRISALDGAILMSMVTRVELGTSGDGVGTDSELQSRQSAAALAICGALRRAI